MPFLTLIVIFSSVFSSTRSVCVSIQMRSDSWNENKNYNIKLCGFSSSFVFFFSWVLNVSHFMIVRFYFVQYLSHCVQFFLTASFQHTLVIITTELCLCMHILWPRYRAILENKFMKMKYVGNFIACVSASFLRVFCVSSSSSSSSFHSTSNTTKQQCE